MYYLTQYFFDQFHPDQAEQAWRDAPSWTSIAYPCYQWPLKVGSRDYIARQIGESLHTYVRAKRAPPAPLSYFVMNVDESHRPGIHWISIAIGMRWSD